MALLSVYPLLIVRFLCGSCPIKEAYEINLIHLPVYCYT
jgi:hypothetical protein